MIAQFVSVLCKVGEAVQIVGHAVGHRMQKHGIAGSNAFQFDRHRFLVKQDDGGAFESTEQERHTVEGGRTRPVLNQ